MDIRLAVVVLGVLLGLVHGHPRAAEEVTGSGPKDSKRIVPVEVSPTKDTKKIVSPEDSTTKDTMKVVSLEDSTTKDTRKVVPAEVTTTKELKKTTVGVKEDTPKKGTPASLGARLKAGIFGVSKLPTSSKEDQDEAVRSARQSPSPPYHQMPFGNDPHTTTVCIQVRSNHQPKVICGPQYGDREDAPPPSAAARYASPYEYARAAPQGYPQAPPAPGRGFPTRRTEADGQPQAVDPGHQPAQASGLGPQARPQGIPTAQTSPLYVHRRFYEPVYSAGVMTPAQALMRLNCAVEPVSGGLVRGGPLGYQEQPFGDTVYINPDGSPAKFGASIGNPQLVHGGAVGFQEQPHGEAVFTLPDGSPAKFGANLVNPPPTRTQNAFAASQGQHWARSAAEEDMAYLNSQMVGSSQNYQPGAWSYGAYPMEAMQGRSAGAEDNGRVYLGYPGSAPPSDDYAKREYYQLQALRESKERLREIQDQLTVFKEREELQKLNSKNSSSSETSKDSSPTGLSIDIKPTPSKSSKRHT